MEQKNYVETWWSKQLRQHITYKGFTKEIASIEVDVPILTMTTKTNKTVLKLETTTFEFAPKTEYIGFFLMKEAAPKMYIGFGKVKIIEEAAPETTELNGTWKEWKNVKLIYDSATMTIKITNAMESNIGMVQKILGPETITLNETLATISDNKQTS
jgi:hypothetical protein